MPAHPAKRGYNQGWVPDWKDINEKKYTIYVFRSEIAKEANSFSSLSPLFFKTAELRNHFLENFRDLIEKLKPLYGIKEGGSE